jgi:hypothetical protein
VAYDRQYTQAWHTDPGAGRYPFADGASLLTRGGRELPQAAFLDASLYPAGAQGPLHLAAVEARPRAVTLVLADARNPRLATAVFDPLDAPAALEFADAAGRPCGVLVCDPEQLVAFQTWPTGRHELGAAQAGLCPSAVIPVPAGGVEGLELPDGTVLAGDVWVVAEDGVVLTDVGGNTIRVDVVGDPLSRRRQCVPAALFRTPRLLRSLNGVGPDDQGNFTLTVGRHLAEDAILRVWPTAEGVHVQAVGQTVGDPPEVG